MSGAKRAVALIPARAGSKRIEGKNVRKLGDHPLIAYAISAALESGVFDAVILSTDSAEYADVARAYGAEIPFLRPEDLAGELSPDIEWVEYTLARLQRDDRTFDAFSILRPTNPFRQAATIRRAWDLFVSDPGADSLRAVERCKQHPGKMWVVDGNRMRPLFDRTVAGAPWHSTPYQALPSIYAQNASLEIAWTRVVFENGTIAGSEVMPFITDGYEAFDVNTPLDWTIAEHLLASGQVELPAVRKAAGSLSHG